MPIDFFKDTICLRCGYPIYAPRHLYDKVESCRQCRTPEENERRDKLKKAFKLKKGIQQILYLDFT